MAQTDGEPLPTLAHDATGDPGVHLAALEQAIANAGVVITRMADLGGAHGYSQPGRITILESLTAADTVAVLVVATENSIWRVSDGAVAAGDDSVARLGRRRCAHR